MKASRLFHAWLMAVLYCAVPGMVGASARIAILPIAIIREGREGGEGLTENGIAQRLTDELAFRDDRRVFRFLAPGGPSGGPGRMPLLDARGLAQRESLEYCLFGIMTVGDRTAELSVSLYESASDRVTRTFYAKEGAELLDGLFDELAARMMAAMYRSLDVHSLGVRHPERILLGGGGGWWHPAGWEDAMVGCFYADTGLRFLSARVSPVSGGLSAAFGFGLSATYQLAFSRPEVEPFSCHFIRARIPLDLRLSSSADLGFSLGIAPFYDFSFAQVQRRHGVEEGLNAGMPGCGASASLDLYLGKRQNLRVALVAGLDVFLPAPMAFQPAIGLDFEVLLKEY